MNGLHSQTHEGTLSPWTCKARVDGDPDLPPPAHLFLLEMREK